MDDNERDRLLIETRQDVAIIKERIQILADHEVRLRSMERFRFAFPSISLLAFFVAGVGIVLRFLG